jgi:hypothetical protein
MKNKLSLTKDAVIALVAERSRSRYGFEFRRSLFNDLLKDGLMFRPRRQANVGKQPSFAYGYEHYRRSLQIVRLITSGFESRDGQRLALFVKGYGLTPREVRYPLGRLYPKLVSQLFRGVRSSYVDTTDDIPPGRKASLLKTMGAPDARLIDAGFVPPTEMLLTAMRSARQQPLRCLSEPEVRQSLEAFASGHWHGSLSHFLSGLLMSEIPEQDDEPDIDYVSKLIRETSDEAYYLARLMYRNLHSGLLAVSEIVKGPSPAHKIAGVEAIIDAARNDPAFMASIFVGMLKMASKDWSLFSALAPEKRGIPATIGFTTTPQ